MRPISALVVFIIPRFTMSDAYLAVQPKIVSNVRFFRSTATSTLYLYSKNKEVALLHGNTCSFDFCIQEKQVFSLAKSVFVTNSNYTSCFDKNNIKFMLQPVISVLKKNYVCSHFFNQCWTLTLIVK